MCLIWQFDTDPLIAPRTLLYRYKYGEYLPPPKSVPQESWILASRQLGAWKQGKAIDTCRQANTMIGVAALSSGTIIAHRNHLHKIMGMTVSDRLERYKPNQTRKLVQRLIWRLAY